MKRRLLLILALHSLFFQGIAQSFYEISKIQIIEITFPFSDWHSKLSILKAASDDYLMAESVKINGVLMDSIGVKYKGSSSYDSTYKKNALHLELNTYKNQNYQGFVDIKLGNNFSDPSMIREVLSYHILKNYMDCPLSNFVKVYINGVYHGLYSNEESINKRFCAKRFYSSDKAFFKCNPTLTPGPTVKSNLKYLGKDSSAYYNFYEIKSKQGWNQLQSLCDTLTNFPDKISAGIDLDKTLWMLAFNNLFINLDSYSGAFAQNYYLYKDHTGRFNPIVWDLNMSIGGFPFAGSPNNGMGSLTLSNMQQLTPYYHETHTDWPLIMAVLKNPVSKRMYTAHYKTLLLENLVNSAYKNRAQEMMSLIDSAVLLDTNKFFSYSQFKNSMTTGVSVGSYSVPGLSALLDSRVNYLQTLSELNEAAPVFSEQKTVPSLPVYNDEVLFSVKVVSANTNSVFLNYRGNVNERFSKIQMFDDGLHKDGNAGDQIFGASLTLRSGSLNYYFYAENDKAGTFLPQRAEHEFFNLKIHSEKAKENQVVINEILCSNQNGERNEYNESSDWIELYNKTNKTVSLKNCYLTDDKLNLKKFQFDYNAVILPKSHFLVWADNSLSTQLYAHTGFNLASEAGQLYLIDSAGLILDSLSYTNQSTNVSLGLCPDGTKPGIPLKKPSLKSSNNLSCLGTIGGLGRNISYSLYPNPAGESICLYIKSAEVCKFNLYNMMGMAVMAEKDVSESAEINLSHLKPGIYVFKMHSIHEGSAAHGKLIKQ